MAMPACSCVAVCAFPSAYNNIMQIDFDWGRGWEDEHPYNRARVFSVRSEVTDVPAAWRGRRPCGNIGCPRPVVVLCQTCKVVGYCGIQCRAKATEAWHAAECRGGSWRPRFLVLPTTLPAVWALPAPSAVHLLQRNGIYNPPLYVPRLTISELGSLCCNVPDRVIGAVLDRLGQLALLPWQETPFRVWDYFVADCVGFDEYRQARNSPLGVTPLLFLNPPTCLAPVVLAACIARGYQPWDHPRTFDTVCFIDNHAGTWDGVARRNYKNSIPFLCGPCPCSLAPTPFLNALDNITATIQNAGTRRAVREKMRVLCTQTIRGLQQCRRGQKQRAHEALVGFVERMQCPVSALRIAWLYLVTSTSTECNVSC